MVSLSVALRTLVAREEFTFAEAVSFAARTGVCYP
jgi:hypothetical protein